MLFLGNVLKLGLLQKKIMGLSIDCSNIAAVDVAIFERVILLI